MSKTIDEKVVEMRFDNKQFEKNVKTTLSTLDKLKAKLNLTGASKGLEEVSKASKKVDFSNMESSLAALEKRFSTTGIVGMTVIQNLTNAAINFAKQIRSFSIGGIIEGGKSRATKIENAKFQIKGLLRDYEDAQERLDDIMADVNYGVESTAYGLDAAASVAAQLVASGMQAGDGMKAALRGISGVAAMTNSTYEDIGRIYTTVAGNGRLMGDQLLQLSARGMNAAAVLAKYLGTSEAKVREMTSKGKISFEMFSKAMDDAFGEHAKDANKTLNGVISNIKAALAKIGADFYGPLIAENSPLVLFLNSVRERINEIRKTLTPITKEVTDRINNFITALNKLFTDKNLFGYNPLANMAEKIQSIKDVLNGATAPIKKAAEIFDKAGHSLKDYEKLVDEIIYGKWKNQPVRQKLLEEAGWNYYRAQNMVNERLGSSFRYADKYVQATEQATTSTTELAVEVENLSDEQMRNMGFTEEQIEAFNELKKMAKKTGIPIKELIELISTKDGKDNSVFSTRYLLLNSLKNIGFTLVSIFKSIGKAFGEVFNVSTEGLFDLIAALHKLTAIIRDKVEKNAENLTNTFKGLFSIIHLITTIVGGAFKLGLKIVNKVLESFGLSLLDVTGIIGEAIYRFEQWITSNETIVSIGKAFIEVLAAIIKYVVAVAGAIKNWVSKNEAIISFVNKIKIAFDKLGGSMDSWIKGLKETDNIPKYIFGGLINGIKSYGPKVWDTIVEVAKGIVTSICDVLQIHSPSRVMFAIGGFIIAGLAAGMLSGSTGLKDTIKGIGLEIAKFFRGIDLGNIIAVGIASGIIYIAKRMLDLANKLVTPIVALSNVLDGLGSALSGIGDAAKDFGKSMKYQGIAAIIKSIAISIGILAASLWVLAKLPADQLQQGAIALGVIGLALAAFIGLVAALSGRLSEVKLPDMGKILASILGMSVGMFIIAKALKTISKIEPDRMASSIFGLMACMTAMGVLIVVLSKVSDKIDGLDDNGKNMKQLGKIFTRLGVSMLLVAVALRLMSKVEPGTIWKTIGIIAGMVALLAAIGVINKYTENSLNQAADTIKAVGIALLLLVITMKLAGKLKKEDFLNGIKVIGVFSLLLLAMMGISKLFKETEMIKVTGSILMAAVAIGILAVITKLMGNMDPDEMRKGLICVGILSLMVMALILVSKQSASLHGTTLMGVALAIAAMGAMVFLLGQLDPEKAKNGLVAVGFITAFIAALIKAAENFDPGNNAVKTLITLTFMLALLAVALIGLSFIDPKKLMASTGSLVAVMLSLAAVIAVVGKMKVGKGVFKTLIIITLVLAAMAGILALLSQVPNIEKAIYGAIGIAILSGTLILMVSALSKMDGRKNINKKFIIALYSLIPLLIGIAIALMVVGNTQNAIQNAIALGILLGTMTVVLAAVSAIGKYLGSGLLAGVLGLLGITVALIGVAIVLSKMDNLQNAVTNAKALALLLAAMSLSLLIVGAIGTNWIGVLAGVLGLLAIVGELFLVVKVLQKMEGLSNAIPNAIALSILLNAMSTALLKLGLIGPLALIADAAIYGLIGAITTIGILATAVGAIMDKFPKLQDFLNKGLPILEQIALSIGKILGNIVAGFMGSVADELANVGQKLSDFMTSATPFIVGAQAVNENVVNGAKYLAVSILALSGANLIDSITTLLSKGKSFSELGTELSKFILNAMPFIMTLSIVKPETLEGAKSLADALLVFTTSGLIDALGKKLFGNVNYSDLGSKLGALGTGLSSFVNNLKGFTEDNLNMIKVACDGIKALAEAAKSIPSSDGVWQKIVGEKDLSTFSSNFPKLGTGIAQFSKALSDGGFSGDNIPVVKSAVEVLESIAKINNMDMNKLVEQINTLGDKLTDFGKKVAGFVSSLNNTSDSDLNAASGKLDTVIQIAQKMASFNSEALERFSNALSTFGTKTLKNFVNALNNQDIKSEAVNAITDLINKLIEAIDSKNDNVKTSATNIVETATKALESGDHTDRAIKAGLNLLNGFINGMDDKDGRVWKKAYSVGSMAVDAINKATDEHSPSKETFKTGKYFDQGFINGIKSLEDKIYSQTYGVGDKARIGLGRAIKGVSNLISEGIDDEFTIRPVLDLSEVQSGAAAINGMLGVPSVGVSANLNAISTGMRTYRQNGGNDVVSAIDKLGKNLGNTTGDTYNINGITYENGSEIQEAVSTLIRAARIERRT